MSDIHGEYWIIDGEVDFADGDVGDRCHESIAIDHVVGQYASDVESLADDLDIDGSAIEGGYDGIDTEAVSSVLSQIHDRLTMGKEEDEEPDPSTLMTDEQADAYIMQHLGCDEEALGIVQGRGHAGMYCMEKLGWIAVRSNNVELYGYDANRQKEVASAIRDILYEEGREEQHDPAEIDLAIYDHKNNKSWYATLEDLERQDVAPKLNQQAMTTYNKSFGSGRDTEENNMDSHSRAKKMTGINRPSRLMCLHPSPDNRRR